MTDSITFSDLDLHPQIMEAINDVGYETPSPIQAQVIPWVLKGADIVGIAQTGTGKTAAFALPLLSRIDIKQKTPQILVLAPTRELAIQVAEAFQRYANRMKGFHVLPVYGGQDYRGQLNALKRGPQVIVGTPGRVMDHIRRGSLVLDHLSGIVLDEADEMLRMGFIDDVEWILEQTPDTRQIALFSATMPTQIRKIAQKYLTDPKEITVKQKTKTADTIRQRCWMVSGIHKLDALTRILEGETFDGVIVFVRTKTATVELAEKLQARGYNSAALNGDLAQQLRERTVNRLKAGSLDILVATDVAARGLDVERISHVINYDIPYDTEAYIHRIGRTGRAGRSGDAILFVANRERRLLSAIERATGKKIENMSLPSAATINAKRVEQFNQKLSDCITSAHLDSYKQVIGQYLESTDADPIMVAAALARMLQGDTPLILKDVPEDRAPRRDRDDDRSGGNKRPYKGKKGSRRSSNSDSRRSPRRGDDKGGSSKPSSRRSNDSEGGSKPAPRRSKDSDGGSKPAPRRSKDTDSGHKPPRRKPKS